MDLNTRRFEVSLGSFARKRRFKYVWVALAIAALLFPTLTPGAAQSQSAKPGVSHNYTGLPTSTEASGVRQRPSGDVLFERIQFGLQASDSYLIWSERDMSLDPGTDDLRDSHDILGLNIATNQLVDVATNSGNQTEGAISGSLVVWQDNGHSCSTCEHDIVGKNLETEATFDVATGTADQSHPAISGKNVVWVEFQGQTQKLLLKNIDDKEEPIEIASVSTAARTTLGRPAISEEYVVWSETTIPSNYSQSDVPTHTVLRAYHLEAGTITTVTDHPAPILEYALADHHVVWSDGYLRLLDLSLNQRKDLFGLSGATPFIKNNYVIWSSTSGNEANDLDVWSINYSDGTTPTPILLVSATGRQIGAVIANGKIAWSSEGGADDDQDRVYTASFAALLASPVAQPQLVGTPPAPSMGDPGSNGESVSNGPAATPTPTPIPRPLVKGMHAAIGNGWSTPNRPTAPTDALVNRTTDAPYFGSVLALQTELNVRDTNAPSPWGPKVANLMHSLVFRSSVDVIVRSYTAENCGPWVLCSAKPDASGYGSPYTRASDILGGLTWRSWMRRVQIENEPDTEWDVCTNCFWRDYNGNPSGYYTWSNTQDYRLYLTINDWFWTIRRIIRNNANACNPSDLACAYLRNNQTFWAPPLNPGIGYKLLDNGLSRYKYLVGMLNEFTCGYAIDPNKKCVSYHLYTTPTSRDSTFGWGIRNHTYDWMNTTWKNGIADGTMRSMITEFGWDPGAMSHCGYTQDSTWERIHPTKSECNSADGAPHYFVADPDVSPYLPGDLYTIQRYYRKKAEIITVWLVRGWADGRADGLNSDGTQKTWFSKYRLSNPPAPHPWCCQ